MFEGPLGRGKVPLNGILTPASITRSVPGYIVNDPRMPNFAHLQGLVGLRAAGSVEQFRANRRRIEEQFRGAGPLPNDAQELIDQEVVTVKTEGMQLVPFLRSRGLVDSLEDWLGTPEYKVRKLSRQGSASRGMIPSADTEVYQFDNSFVVQPIFATWERLHLDIRTKRTSSRLGFEIDGEMIQQNTRNVNLAVEDQGVNGIGWTVAGNSTYGLLTAPNANTVSYSGSNPAWDHASKSGKEITDDLNSMVVALKGDNHLEFPLALFVNTDYYNALNDKKWSDGTTTIERSVLEELESKRYGSSGQPLTVVPVDALPDDRTALVALSTQVVKVVEGQQPASLVWMSPDGMNVHGIVLACAVVVWRDDYSGQSGVVTGNV